MIHYHNHFFPDYFRRVFTYVGSVLPLAISVALPNAVLTMAVRFVITNYDLVPEEGLVVVTNSGLWSAFNSIVGFLIVFRSSQAYSRFWEAVSHTQVMRSNWAACASALCAFCRASKADRATILKFKHMLLRLISMMHALALSELEDTVSDDPQQVKAFNIEVIDASGLDAESLKILRSSSSRVELIYQWIQLVIVDNIGTGVLAIPPPILSRSFQELENGMVAFYNAMKTTCIPFPFPYAQACDILLGLHWLLVPAIAIQWTESILISGLFSFLQVVLLWALNFIAVEIEHPFGSDPNDLELADMQNQMNAMLIMLLREGVDRVPELSRHALRSGQSLTCDDEEVELIVGSTICGSWSELKDGVIPKASSWNANRSKAVRAKAAKMKDRERNELLAMEKMEELSREKEQVRVDVVADSESMTGGAQVGGEHKDGDSGSQGRPTVGFEQARIDDTRKPPTQDPKRPLTQLFPTRDPHGAEQLGVARDSALDPCGAPASVDRLPSFSTQAEGLSSLRTSPESVEVHAPRSPSLTGSSRENENLIM